MAAWSADRFKFVQQSEPKSWRGSRLSTSSGSLQHTEHNNVCTIALRLANWTERQQMGEKPEEFITILIVLARHFSASNAQHLTNLTHCTDALCAPNCERGRALHTQCSFYWNEIRLAGWLSRWREWQKMSCFFSREPACVYVWLLI